MVAKVCKVFTSLLLVVMLALAAALAGPLLFGAKSFVVLTGSMTPTIPVGSIVYTQTADPETLEAGDVVTYTALESQVMVTHRVVENHPDSRELVTKGDANNDNDSPVAYDRLVGKMALHIPYLGFLTTKLQSREGILIIGGAMIVLVALLFLPEIFKPDKKTTPEAEEAAKT